MKAGLMIVLLSVVCFSWGWGFAAQSSTQEQSSHNDQESLAISSRPLTASDADLQLLRQDLRTQKQKLIAENLPMTELEADKFWAVYNRYTADLRHINDEKFRLVKQYGDMWGMMSNDEALIYIRRWLEVDAQVHELRSKYVMEVSQALPGKKAATFFQLERRISMLIDIQLASQLPLAISQDKP
ncbi:MAG TPA: hypothetical protein VKB40_07735 [Candidatus Acidoferrales bacterium]|jgi:hypothetical protein|nr:hypothetical protein [Candidatus Acidoferrales bacterium]